MNNSENILSEDIIELLKTVVKFQESYTELKNDYMKLQDAHFSLKNMFKVAQDNDRQHILFRNHTEGIIIQQNKIIRDFVDVKEDNLKLKEEIKCVKETLENSYKEIEKVHCKAADELKSLQDSHEEEMLNLREQYLKQEQHKEKDFLESKKQLENVMTELKQNIESLETEKNIVIEVTVREYEDRLKILRTQLEESKAERKSLEERNITNMNLFTKRLENQEKNYISMLETVRREMVAANTASKSANKQKQIQKRISENTNLTNPQPVSTSSKPRAQKPVYTSQLDICNPKSQKNDMPVNISYYNHLQIPPPHSAYGQMSSHSCFSSTSSSGNGDIRGNVNNNDVARDVYSYINTNPSKPNSTSLSDNAISNQNYDEPNSNHFNLGNNSSTNKQFSVTTNKVQLPKRRKLYNPQDKDDFI